MLILAAAQSGLSKSTSPHVKIFNMIITRLALFPGHSSLRRHMYYTHIDYVYFLSLSLSLLYNRVNTRKSTTSCFHFHWTNSDSNTRPVFNSLYMHTRELEKIVVYPCFSPKFSQNLSPQSSPWVESRVQVFTPHCTIAWETVGNSPGTGSAQTVLQGSCSCKGCQEGVEHLQDCYSFCCLTCYSQNY